MVTKEALIAQKQRLEAELDPYFRYSDDHSVFTYNNHLLAQITQLTIAIADYDGYKAVKQQREQQQQSYVTYNFSYKFKQLHKTLQLIRACKGTLANVEFGERMSTRFASLEDVTTFKEALACL